MENCDLSPYGSQIICRVQKKDTGGFQNGLYIPDLKKDEHATFHEVVAVGPKVEEGFVKIGNLIVLTESNTVTLRYKGDIYIVSEASNVMLVLEN